MRLPARCPAFLVLAAALSVISGASATDFESLPTRLAAHADSTLVGPGQTLKQTVSIQVGIDAAGATYGFIGDIEVPGVPLSAARIIDARQSIVEGGQTLAATVGFSDSSELGVSRASFRSVASNGYTASGYALSYWLDTFNTLPLAGIGGPGTMLPQVMTASVYLHEILEGSANTLYALYYTDGPTFEDNFQTVIRSTRNAPGEYGELLTGTFTAKPGVAYQLIALYYTFANGNGLADGSHTSAVTGLVAPSGYATTSNAIATGYLPAEGYGISTAVPEPASVLLFGAGIAALGFKCSARRRLPCTPR